MAKTLSIILFSLSANLDNFVIGSAYGIKKIKINLITIFTVSFISTFITYLSMVFGSIIIKFIPSNLANLIGSITIISLGLYFSVASINQLMNPKLKKEIALKDLNTMIAFAKQSDRNCSGDICFKESIYISLALSINNIAAGIAAYMAGIIVYLALICIFTFSVLNLTGGYLLGNKYLGKFLGKYAPLLAGLLLIIFGILEIVI